MFQSNDGSNKQGNPGQDQAAQQNQQQAQMFTLNYQTLDQDTRRVNQPIRGNHHAGGAQNSAVNKQGTRDVESTADSRIQKRQPLEPGEPTPSFNSQKQASANMQSKMSSENNPQSDLGMKREGSVSNSNSYVRKRQSSNRAAVISSHNNGFNNDHSMDNQSQNNQYVAQPGLNDSTLSG